MKLLPDKIFSQHSIALGKTRSGKSSAMRLIVEDQLDQDRRVCIVDPKGDWWGIKSSGTGKQAGYPVVIFGGEHADVPLNQHSGAQVAELIATGNRPSLIDLGGWHVGERTRFFIDFASTLFKHVKAPILLVIDECHNFCPQGKVLDVDAGKMLHWSNRLASEGGGRGIVLLAASQRPQKVHKDFVTSMETLFAFRVIHPLDRQAMKDWIDGAPDRDKGREVLETLASMPRGQAWVWSPEIGFGPKCVKFPFFKTFDSFAAPTGESAVTLKGWAEIDLDEVREKLAAVVQEAEANDPKLLKRKIAELQKQLALRPEAAPAEPQIIEKPVLKEGQLARVEKIVDRAQGLMNGQLAALNLELGNLRETIKPAFAVPPTVKKLSPIMREIMRRPAPVLSAKPVAPSGEVTKYQRKLLEVLLDRYPLSVTRGQLGVLSGCSTRSSMFRPNVSALVGMGMVQESGGSVTATESAVAACPDYQPAPRRGRAARDYWLQRLPAYESEILRVLCESARAMSHEEISSMAGKSMTSSMFRPSIRNLVELHLAEEVNDGVRASEELFD